MNYRQKVKGHQGYPPVHQADRTGWMSIAEFGGALWSAAYLKVLGERRLQFRGDGLLGHLRQRLEKLFSAL